MANIIIEVIITAGWEKKCGLGKHITSSLFLVFSFRLRLLPLTYYWFS